MSDKSLDFELRQEGVEEARRAEVEAAHVEASGQVSVLKAPWARPPQRRDKDAVRRTVAP